MKNFQTNKGQVMLLTVLLTGGVLLAATAVAGLMMIYQIRQTTAMIDSVQAIFAADAALEWSLFCRVVWTIQKENGMAPDIFSDFSCPYSNPTQPDMSNGASAVISVINEGIRVVGTSHQSSRAFEMTFSN